MELTVADAERLKGGLAQHRIKSRGVFVLTAIVFTALSMAVLLQFQVLISAICKRCPTDQTFYNQEEGQVLEFFA
ncbi:hypothetical protein GRI69_04750 [Erythrobacter vulgaris]|uniref:Uncharacterized protein n=1 Tax=Qipengyuania vulgaris TaxID=291985 RepID=A0A844XQV2_9SPHN|nr:hypothetical protein [Qipengyuania vulgaris]MXO47563.1 hypothetical protein [Qipengyuania vulgaris]